MKPTNCPSLHPKPCDGSLYITDRDRDSDISEESKQYGKQRPTKAACRKCGKVFTDHILHDMGININDIEE